MFDQEPPPYMMVSPFRARFDVKTEKAVLTTSKGTISPVLEAHYSDNGSQLRKKYIIKNVIYREGTGTEFGHFINYVWDEMHGGDKIDTHFVENLMKMTSKQSLAVNY